MCIDSNVTMDISEKALLSWMVGTLTYEIGTPAVPNYQGAASYSHSRSLLAKLKQYFPLFSLDETDKIVLFSLSALLFWTEEATFLFPLIQDCPFLWLI